MLLQTDSEILKLVSGRIIGQVAQKGIEEYILWPGNFDTDIALSFPKHAIHTSEWNRKFQQYLDLLAEQGFIQNMSV